MKGLSEDIMTTVHTMLYVLNSLNGRSGFHKVFKIMYFADQKHLIKYGSPITNDRYMAMQNGPVPSLAYDIAKSVRGEGLMLPNRENFSSFFEVKGGHNIIALCKADMDYLSASEVEALNESIEENRGLNFGQLTDKSHDAAWKKANVNGDMKIVEIAKAGAANSDMVDYIKTHLENMNSKCL